MRCSSRSVGLLICFSLSAVYFITAKGNVEVTDTSFSIRTAKSIIQDRSFIIDATPEEESYVFRTSQGRGYSKYGMGLAFVLVPYVWSGLGISSLTTLPEEMVTGFMVSLYNIAFGAVSCAIFFVLARLFGRSQRLSVIMSLILGLCTMCWRYSVWDFSEATQMFFVLLSVYGVFRNTRCALLLASGSYGCLLLLKAVHIIFLPLILLYIMVRNRSSDSPKRILLFLSLVSVAVALVLVSNYVRFGSVIEFGYGEEVRKFQFSGLWSNAGLLLFSMEKGMFIYNPILIASLFGIVEFYRRFRSESLFCLAVVVVNFLVAAMWHSPGGGWSWGPRLLVSVLPLWLLPVSFVRLENKLIKALVIAAAAASVLIQIVSVLQREHEYQHIRNNMVAAEHRVHMPPDIIGNALLLKHKILEGNNSYRLSEFGIDSNEIINTSQFETYRGLNLWYCHLARYFDRWVVHLVPIAFIPLIAVLSRRLYTAAVE